MYKKKLNYIALISFVFAVACQSMEKPSDTEAQGEETSTEAEAAVEEEQVEKTLNFGKVIAADDAVSVDDFANLLQDNDSVKVKLSTVAKDVCKKKGCWMKVQTADDKLMRVSFKDYGFFVPKDISGKKVVIEGIAVRDTISVEDLRHYAEDGGESEEAIAAITEPEVTTSFIAEGVVIVN